MQRYRLRASALGLAAAFALGPQTGRAGWMSVSAGPAGAGDPTEWSRSWFAPPAASPYLVVDQVSGAGRVRAVTGGGIVYFGGMGTPVILDLSNGSAYLAGGNGPKAVLPVAADPLATGAPVSRGAVPADAAHLTAELRDPGPGGVRELAVTITSPTGLPLVSDTIPVPLGGWWVLGLGPDTLTPTEPVPDPGAPAVGEVRTSERDLGVGSLQVAPEPASIVGCLAGLAAILAARVRGVRGRTSATAG